MGPENDDRGAAGEVGLYLLFFPLRHGMINKHIRLTFINPLNQRGGAQDEISKHSFYYDDTSGAGDDLTIEGSNAFATSNASGGDIILDPGDLDGSGLDGGLKITKHVYYPKTDVSLTADDTAITVQGKKFILLSSDSGTAADRTFTLTTASVNSGHSMTLCWSGANAGEMLDTGNQKLSSAWTPTDDDCLELIFDGTDWLETNRSTN
jgi:hypothetical protein